MKNNVQEKYFLTEQVTALFHLEILLKFKTIGCPIACMIGQINFENSPLNLDASANLSPYTMHKQLGLGEQKQTPVILQLADRSVQHLKGVNKDELVQIDNFYLLVDFIIIDTTPVANVHLHILIILECPFLATTTT